MIKTSKIVLKILKDSFTLDRVLKNFPQFVDESFNVDDWLKNTENVCLTDKTFSNVSLFEKISDNTYCGHIFFSKIKGKEALSLARLMLSEFFSIVGKDAQLIGFTPIENKKAIWFNTKLGFTKKSLVETEHGLCVKFELEKKERYT